MDIGCVFDEALSCEVALRDAGGAEDAGRSEGRGGDEESPHVFVRRSEWSIRR
jgi:hypothetical protein